jgi:hypothetical protein
VDSHGIRSGSQQPLAGASLIVRIDHLDPLEDFPRLNRVLEMGGMPRHEPKCEGIPQAPSARTQPIGEAVGKRTGSAGEELSVVRECQILNGQRLLRRGDDCLPSEGAPTGKTVEAIKHEATTFQVADGGSQLRPRIERADCEAKVWPVNQGCVRLNEGGPGGSS